MSILFFNRCVSPQVDPFTSTFARSFITSSQRCCFIRPKLPLFFSRPPTLFLQGLRFLYQVSFYFCEVSPFFSVNVLTWWFSRRCSTSSSFLIPFSSPVDSSQVLLIIPFSSFQCLLIPVHLIIILLLSICYSGVLNISRRFVFPLCIRSSSFEIGISFKSFNSTGATSLLNLFNGVLLSGP